MTIRILSEVDGKGVPQHMELHAVSADGHPVILDATITDLSHDPAVGGVVINETPTFRADQMPYGGVKQSGNTREGPRAAVREMTVPKLVVLQLPGQ